MSHFRLFLGLGKAPALLKVEWKNVGFELSIIKSAKMGQLLNTKLVISPKLAKSCKSYRLGLFLELIADLKRLKTLRHIAAFSTFGANFNFDF